MTTKFFITSVLRLMSVCLIGVCMGLVLCHIMFGRQSQEVYEQNYLVSDSNTDILNSVIVDSIDSLGELTTDLYE